MVLHAGHRRLKDQQRDARRRCSSAALRALVTASASSPGSTRRACWSRRGAARHRCRHRRSAGAVRPSPRRTCAGRRSSKRITATGAIGSPFSTHRQAKRVMPGHAAGPAVGVVEVPGVAHPQPGAERLHRPAFSQRAGLQRATFRHLSALAPLAGAPVFACRAGVGQRAGGEGRARSGRHAPAREAFGGEATRCPGRCARRG